MIEDQKGGSKKAAWFAVPRGGRLSGGRCWTGGVPNIEGKCCYCGCKKEEHRKIEK